MHCKPNPVQKNCCGLFGNSDVFTSAHAFLVQCKQISKEDNKMLIKWGWMFFCSKMSCLCVYSGITSVFL